MENLYLVCLVPPPLLVADIEVIRNEISDEFKVFESLKRPVHITLYHPVKVVGAAQDKAFFDALENAAFSKGFQQVLKNFNAFAPHTFYIRVEENQGIMSLEKRIKQELKPLQLLAGQNNFKFTPHLTLAFRDIKPPVFHEIIQKFKDRNFKRTFWVDGFSIYKHSQGRWQPFREIKFKDTAIQNSVSTLFD